jgi:hypothetical protein
MKSVNIKVATALVWIGMPPHSANENVLFGLI